MFLGEERFAEFYRDSTVISLAFGEIKDSKSILGDLPRLESLGLPRGLLPSPRPPEF
jgi:hypothetical protein